MDIVGFDVQADGGCHVARLGEIGRRSMTKAENKGKAPAEVAGRPSQYPMEGASPAHPNALPNAHPAEDPASLS